MLIIEGDIKVRENTVVGFHCVYGAAIVIIGRGVILTIDLQSGNQ